MNAVEIIKETGKIRYPKCTVILVECKCHCGKIFTARKPHVLNGHTKSCGCRKNSLTTKTHGLTNTPTYRTWASMISRCNNPNATYFKNYGGRGIKVCDRWMVFDNFLADMGIRPSIDYQLDRINNDKGYNKENCKWSTRKEQCNNKTNNVKYNYKGQLLSVTEISRLSGLTRSTISNWKNRSKYSTEKIEMLINAV